MVENVVNLFTYCLQVFKLRGVWHHFVEVDSYDALAVPNFSLEFPFLTQSALHLRAVKRRLWLDRIDVLKFLPSLGK